MKKVLIVFILFFVSADSVFALNYKKDCTIYNVKGYDGNLRYTVTDEIMNENNIDMYNEVENNNIYMYTKKKKGYYIRFYYPEADSINIAIIASPKYLKRVDDIQSALERYKIPYTVINDFGLKREYNRDFNSYVKHKKQKSKAQS